MAKAGQRSCTSDRFLGIDAPDADTLAVQLEGVAVDHQGRTMSAGRGGDVVC